MKPSGKKIFIFITVLLLTNLFSLNSQLSNSISTDPPLQEEDLFTARYYSYGLDLDIIHAYYYDLDKDGKYDDILTIVRLSTLSGYIEYVVTDLYQYITIPSGTTYYCVLTVYGWYDVVYVKLYWYNLATERGWYKFKAVADSISYNWISTSTETVTFDPPESTPIGGPPGVKVIIY